jgi:hypothetical protein
MMRDLSPHRDLSPYAMPYCAIHNRLFPHPGVGWLTPASVEGCALIPVRCPRCIQEDGDDITHYVWGRAPLACH